MDCALSTIWRIKWSKFIADSTIICQIGELPSAKSCFSSSDKLGKSSIKPKIPLKGERTSWDWIRAISFYCLS